MNGSPDEPRLDPFPIGLGQEQMHRLLRHVLANDIPTSQDLFSARELEAYLEALKDPPFSVIAVGDTLLGDRAAKTLAREGPDYAFHAVRPLLWRATIVLANLEGPLARASSRHRRRYAYKVDPDLARPLTRAGLNIFNLANNHVLDCGRSGLLETLEALETVGAAVTGAGLNRQAAHAPVLRQAGPWRVGFLGYYWNRWHAATRDRPGVAIGSRKALQTDIGNLRERADRIVVSFHWGDPYRRHPSEEDRATARFAVECGADLVIGHHPRIIQPFEIHRDRPIFYSIGNFTFGSWNSRAEGLLLGIRFDETQTTVITYPLYVKNRDPRVRFQPKVLRGAGAHRALRRLAEISGPAGAELKFEAGRGILRLRRSGARRAAQPL